MEDSDDEATDFSDFIEVKQDPYFGECVTNMALAVEPEPHLKIERQEPASSSGIAKSKVSTVNTKSVVVTIEEDTPVKANIDKATIEPTKHTLGGDQQKAVDEITARIQKLKFLGLISYMFLYRFI